MRVHFYLKYILFLVSVVILLAAAAETRADIHAAGNEESKNFRNSLTEYERKWLHDHPVISVVSDPDWPPVEFSNELGEFSGMSGDYLNLVEKRLGIKFKRIQNMAWHEAYPLLKTGAIDMTTCVAETPERLHFWSFTKPYLTIPIVIATQLNITYIANMKELSGRSVAIVEGYAIDDWIPKDYPEINLVRVKTALEGLQMLQRGEVYAYIDNLLIIGDYQAKMKVSNIKIAGQTPYTNAQSMAIRKDWQVLAGIIEKALDSISDTEKQDIYRKWLPVRYEYGFDYALFRRVLAVFIVILLGMLLWSWKLAREIRYRKMAEAEIIIKNQELESLNRELTATMEEIEATNEELISTSSELQESEMKYKLMFESAGDSIIITDNSGKPLAVNPSACKMLGLSKAELMSVTASEVDILGEALTSQKNIAGLNEQASVIFETTHHRKDGSLVFAEVSARKIIWDNQPAVMNICRDISERKQADEKIRLLLAEKELLLQEVHHRIKNNMNTIKGLLTLQLSAEENPSVAASLKDAENRVQSMIMLYDKLYCTENFRELSVKDYLQSLVEDIISSFANRGIVEIKTGIEDFILNIQTLSPLGIIVNELLTNMMKYAFTGRDSGVITLSAALRERRAVIVIQDNGNGIPESISFENSTGFGLSLVGMLTEQIGGSIKIERGNGSKFILEFDL